MSNTFIIERNWWDTGEGTDSNMNFGEVSIEMIKQIRLNFIFDMCNFFAHAQYSKVLMLRAGMKSNVLLIYMYTIMVRFIHLYIFSLIKISIW